MKKLNILLVLFVTIILAACSSGGSDKKWVRDNANSPEAAKDIEAMNKALAIMRAKDCSDPTSWYYQAGIHWVPDSIGSNPLCESYHNYTELKTAWDNCTHTPVPYEEVHFLVWHRLYIYHFEKIVRKLSGYEDFALPYWAYTNDDTKDKTLPIALRNPKSSLYEACRFDSLNMGYPVSGEIERALDLTALMNYTDYRLFNRNMDAAPHGAMHNYIGLGNDVTGNLKFNNPITGTVTNSGLMGEVPTAAFDPVFWMHHANIDRIWQQWTNSPNGKKVTLDILNSVEWNYVFFDENGKKVTYTMDEVIKIIYNMPYDYDDTKVYEKDEPVTSVKGFVKTVASLNTKKLVSKSLTHVGTLKNTSSNSGKAVIEVSTSFDKHPYGVYEVYANQPAGEKLDPSSQYFVGYMTFFGKEHKAPGEKICTKGCCTPVTADGRILTVFEFEVTAQSEYNITVYKASGQHTANLVIEKMELKVR